MTGDAYETLGVTVGASPDELRTAFRRRAREVHPDLHPEDLDATRRFQELMDAYRWLTAEHDRQAAARPSPRRDSWPGADPEGASAVETVEMRVLVREQTLPAVRRIELLEPARLAQGNGGWWSCVPDPRDPKRFWLEIHSDRMEAQTEHSVLMFRNDARSTVLLMTVSRIKPRTENPERGRHV
jgi:curved DNA-binding protein CbpA